MKKVLCAIIAISCTLIILGAARQSDLGLIGPLESIKRCVVATPLLYVSLKIGGIIQ